MPSNPLAPLPGQPLLRQHPLPLAAAAQSADAAAAAKIFDLHRQRLAEQTRRRQEADLRLFAAFLVASSSGQLSIDPSQPALVEQAEQLGARLLSEPTSWTEVTWGLVQGFLEWQLQAGYAVGSVNVRLSTVKAYAALAARAGALDPNTYALIKLVQGLRHAQGRRIDRQRSTTRVGAKKAAPVSVTASQAEQLKRQADTRERLLMCLLIDHGLRVGEVAALLPEDFDLDVAQLHFYRSKVDKRQRHDLSDDTLAAAEAHLLTCAPDTPLFPSDRDIRRIVARLGQAVGLERLSPHDLRHLWATLATRNGTALRDLQEAGGWSSPAMPIRYAEAQEVANRGVKLK